MHLFNWSKRDLIGVRETTHTAHNTEDVDGLCPDEQRGQVSNSITGTLLFGVDVGIGVVGSSACLGGDTQGGVVDATEIACTCTYRQ